jgi:uncharacterized protein
VVCITGPRQSGKTTLARMVVKDLPYVNFEDPLTRDFFTEDPRGFLHQYRNGAVFDEVQHVPRLFSFLQTIVDEDPKTGRFVLTGSQHFGSTERLNQSLAGRTAILSLLPFSIRELTQGRMLAENLDRVLWSGAYPPVHDRSLRPDRWYANYIATYIQRDVRQISQIQNLDTFTRFMRLCAGSTSQLINTSRLGSECGVDHKTIRNWLTVLQASYVVGLLPPYFRNFRKRVIKTPKLFFFDTGLVCHLLGILTPDQLTSHPLRGAVFESWVFAELAKALLNSGREMQFYFWRTHGGQEVDFILEHSGHVDAIEVKSGMTVTPAMINSLQNALSTWDVGVVRSWLVYGGQESIKLAGCTALPWKSLTYPLPSAPDLTGRQ